MFGFQIFWATGKLHVARTHTLHIILIWPLSLRRILQVFYFYLHMCLRYFSYNLIYSILHDFLSLFIYMIYALCTFESRYRLFSTSPVIYLDFAFPKMNDYGRNGISLTSLQNYVRVGKRVFSKVLRFSHLDVKLVYHKVVFLNHFCLYYM